MVPIAPSKTTTCSGSSSRAINAFSGNCRLRFGRSTRAGTAHGVVFRFRMMDDQGGCGLLGHQLKCLRQIHAECFPGREKPEDRGMVVQIGTRSVPPRVTFARFEA